jgi:hypothetical protein
MFFEFEMGKRLDDTLHNRGTEELMDEKVDSSNLSSDFSLVECVGKLLVSFLTGVIPEDVYSAFIALSIAA